MLLAPDVHWIEGVQANVFLCVEETHCTLVDTGRENIDRVDLILNYLERLNFYPAGLQQIVLTHAHPDQVGNVAELQKICEATIYASTAVCERLLAGDADDTPPNAKTEETFRLENWRQHLPIKSQKFPPLSSEVAETYLKPIEAGDVLPVLGGLEALPAEGHAVGHLAYYLPQRGVLFAGDALPINQPDLLEQVEDKPLAQQTMRALLALSPAVVASSSAPPTPSPTLSDILGAVALTR